VARAPRRRLAIAHVEREARLREFVAEWLRAPHGVVTLERQLDVTRTIAAGKFWLLASGYRELTQNVIWPGKIESDARGFLELSEKHRNPDVLFLANIQPDLQLQVLRQCRRPRRLP